MDDKTEILERRLQQHRSSTDRTSLLEARVREHRSEQPGQQQRRKLLEDNHADGTSRMFWEFVEQTPEAAIRWDDIGALHLLDEKKVSAAVAFRTGVLSVDIGLGGGLPAGFTEIYGEESTGKTTFIIEMIHSAQSKGLEVALCPSEFVDLPYFERLGVALDRLLIMRGRGEGVLVEAGRFISGGRKRAVFIDSATGLRPENDEFARWREMLGSWIVAVHPRVSTDSAVVMTNQVRAKLSASSSRMFAGGSDSTATRIAGAFDCRIALSRASVTEQHYDMLIDIVSNTIRKPARVFSVPVVKGEGIDVWKDLVRVASKVGVLEQHGSWYYYEKTTLGQGEDAVAKLLKDNEPFSKIVLNDTLQVACGVGE